MNNSNPWSLIETGDYANAASVYLQLYELEKDMFHLHNGGLAYLMLKDYQKALDCFTTILNNKDKRFLSSSEYNFAGVCCWCLSRTDEAIKYWDLSLSAPYTDAAGGILTLGLLFFASIRKSNEMLLRKVTKLLSKQLRFGETRNLNNSEKQEIFERANITNWPGALAPYLLDKIEFLDLVKEVDKVSSPILRTRMKCQVNFYNGVKHLQQSDLGGYEQALILCAENKGGILEQEYHIALYEKDILIFN